MLHLIQSKMLLFPFVLFC